MTPLAQRFARRLTLPLNRREQVFETDNGLSAFTDIHCFECSDVWDFTTQMSADKQVDLACNVTFFPAPRTWVEWQWPECGRYRRQAVLFVETEGGFDAFFYLDGEHGLAAHFLASGRLGLKNPLQLGSAGTSAGASGISASNAMVLKALLMVAFINTPKVIGRRQFMPHRGLERALTKSLGIGKFPLHAWHEIKLEVFKPIEIDDGEPHEAHLTGRRALHFCRAHLRVRLGQLEYVTSHWRGDPALGIKQTRYRVLGSDRDKATFDARRAAEESVARLVASADRKREISRSLNRAAESVAHGNQDLLAEVVKPK
jgi:hypothetical protein